MIPSNSGRSGNHYSRSPPIDEHTIMGGFKASAAVASGMYLRDTECLKCSGGLFRLALLFLVLAIVGTNHSHTAAAQTSLVRGFITDSSTGLSLPGANVRLTDLEGKVFGTASNTDGFYAVGGLDAGPYVFEVSFVGYKPAIDTLNVRLDWIESVSVALDPRTARVGEVVVDADREGAASITGGLQTIRPAEIERIPSPDVSGDLASYLSALPGFVTIGDQGGQFFIRGGEPWQNLVLLDGMIVYQPFHILGFFSAFPSEIISSADVYAGGYGAKYGGRISSVIDVSSRHGNRNRFAGSASLSSFLVSATAEGPVDRNHRFSFLASFRQSVIEEGASRLVDDSIPYNFNDFFGKLYGELTPNSRVSLSYLQTSDRGLSSEAIGLTPLAEVRWTNQAIGVRYIVLPGDAAVFADFAVSYSSLESELGPDANPIRSSNISRFNTSADMTFYGGAADVRWGIFARTIKLESKLDGLFQNLESRKEFVTEVGIYVEPDFKPTRELTLSPSLRVHAFPSKRNTFIEPRFRAVWERRKHRISAAFGVYHQEVIGVTDRRDATSVFTAWAAVPDRDSVPVSVHSIIGYGFQPSGALSLSAEVYYKWLSNLFIAEWTGFPRLTTRLQPADGRARGIDLRMEIKKQGLYGHLTYGLSWVNYEAQQASLQLWFGSNTFNFRPAHDRRHQINLLVGGRYSGLNLTARWQFGSGLPFSRAQGFDGLVLIDGVVDVFAEEGSRRVIFERPFNGQLPAYHRLDLSANYSFSVNAANVTMQASVLNVYDRKNIFSLDVFTQQRTDQLPVIPSLGIKVEFR